MSLETIVVSNPQRISTNQNVQRRIIVPINRFQTLKGSLQTKSWPHASSLSLKSFKPSKDLYKRVV
ncbi:MAG: hypothetical protein MjAS7_2015 [Metallosphaera javensis (ex Sakai et al. 2022)]|nr:MAG: hypothetical protein MjAS7_2015 [Metallosphaera javensis (ex Sakai et al. 2022)]